MANLLFSSKKSSSKFDCSVTIATARCNLSSLFTNTSKPIIADYDHLFLSSTNETWPPLPYSIKSVLKPLVEGVILTEREAPTFYSA